MKIEMFHTENVEMGAFDTVGTFCLSFSFKMELQRSPLIKPISQSISVSMDLQILME